MISVIVALLFTPAVHPAHEVCLTDTTTCVQAEDGSWVNTDFYDEVQAEDGSWVPADFYEATDVIHTLPVYADPAPDAYWAAYAWSMFDLYGADLLTNGGHVELIGMGTTPFAVDAHTITVWDTAGNHFLFEVR